MQETDRPTGHPQVQNARDLAPLFAVAAEKNEEIREFAQQGQVRILHDETAGQIMLGVVPENFF